MIEYESLEAGRVARKCRQYLLDSPPISGRIYLVAGGPALFRRDDPTQEGRWYSGVEEPYYTRELQWPPKWWFYFPTFDPCRALWDEERIVDDLRGALQFIMAFYEPGQTYLDTEAWKCAEANARAALKRAAEHSSAPVQP